MKEIDAAVIGAGPAGLTAGIYLGRARLKTIIFEKALAGGQMAVSELIENFPGFPDGISGVHLAENMRNQALKYGAEIVEEEVKDIKKSDNFMIKTAGDAEYKAKAVIIATGAQPKRLGVPGEDMFIGKGVSYCATCDAPLFKEKTVLVVGGGDTAVQEALFLAKYAKKVYLVHRRDRLRATEVLAERLAVCKNIEPVWNSVVTEIFGEKKVKGVKMRPLTLPSPLWGEGKGEGGHALLECDGVFIFAGIAPNSGIVKGLVKEGEAGYIITDDDMKTYCEGMFACGDVRNKLLRQVVTACGEAATAAVSAQHYIQTLEGTVYI